MQNVKIKKLDPRAIIPEYKTSGSAGFDLHVLIDDRESYVLRPGETSLFNTGLSFSIPDGFEIQIRSRSGLAMKGIVVTNSPGTIDSDYVGPISILLTNHSKDIFLVRNLDRVAQGVLSKVEKAQFIEVEKLEDTERGEGGFGSTGLS